MNYYKEIKTKLMDNEIYIKAKDYSKEKHTVITYFEIGKLLFEAGKKYGKNIIGKYSIKLTMEVGKKYNERTLRRIRQFYETFKDSKWSAMPTQLTWSHYTELLVLKDFDEINYYISISNQQNLTYRELHERIKNNEYKRLPEDTKYKLIKKYKINSKDLVKNPIILKNKYNYESITEKYLKEIILNEIETFMKELGIGFTFVGSEYKIKIGSSYNYIDLLLFNYKYNCFVVIELKVTELKKEHIGQILTYTNYIDKNLKEQYQEKTIGIIIVKKNNNFVMEYCTDERIIAREYIII